MDCDTTGIEPDFALVKFKKLAGGGYFKIINSSMPPRPGEARLRRRADRGHRRATAAAPARSRAARTSTTRRLQAKGFTDEVLERIESALPAAFELAFAFNRWTLGDDVLQGRRSALERASSSTSRASTCWRASASRASEIAEANDYVCGTMTDRRRAAPQAPNTSPVFDCANKCGKIGQRFLSAESRTSA